MPRYHLELSDYECMLILIALARILPSNLADYADTNVTALMRRLLEAPKLPEGQADAQTAPPVGMPAAPIASGVGAISPTAPERDTASDGELTITLLSADVDGKALVTTFKTRTTNGVRTKALRCWDAAQFDRIKASVGKSTTFLTRESKGFTNIVGVKK